MYDIAIVGAGPAGASAAIFTAKAGKKTVVFDNDKGMTRRAWLCWGKPIQTGFGSPWEAAVRLAANRQTAAAIPGFHPR